MAEIKPTASEEPLALQLIDLAVSEDTAIYQTAFRIDQSLYIHTDAPLVVTDFN
jgi:hypothetical protein